MKGRLGVITRLLLAVAGLTLVMLVMGGLVGVLTVEAGGGGFLVGMIGLYFVARPAAEAVGQVWDEWEGLAQPDYHWAKVEPK